MALVMYCIVHTAGEQFISDVFETLWFYNGLEGHSWSLGMVQFSRPHKSLHALVVCGNQGFIAHRFQYRRFQSVYCAVCTVLRLLEPVRGVINRL